MSSFKSSKLYKAYLQTQWIQEPKILLQTWALYLKDAKAYYAAGGDKGSLRDYRKALFKHRVTINEYVYGYEYWKLTESERDEFISGSEMRCVYRKMIHGRVRDIFHKKDAFLRKFSAFVHRDWSLVRDLSFEQFNDFINRHDAILKPMDATQGQGIFKLTQANMTDLRSFYDKCYAENYLMEECVQSCAEIAEFHPQSLNTIRVVTVSKDEKCVVFGALLRMGAGGSVIDNTHAGGIFVPINTETGRIDVPAIDGKNNKYEAHPDTGEKIVGFEIPHWQDIVETCSKATRTIPGIVFAGWDLCVLPDGRVEIIEGNHAPDFDGGLQVPLKIGVKKKIFGVIKALYGIEPQELLSLFGKNYNNYDFY